MNHGITVVSVPCNIIKYHGPEVILGIQFIACTLDYLVHGFSTCLCSNIMQLIIILLVQLLFYCVYFLMVFYEIS